jgi:large subunit ribosomal protein L4
MAALKAPLVGGKGDVTLDEGVFGAEIKPHLVHEAVRAELNEARQGTRGAKSRGLVSGGRSKPWRQKGTGRARQGTTRAPQWKGGGVAFPPTARSFDVKMNKKAQRAALRSALSDHVQAGTIGVVSDDVVETPSTKQAVDLLKGWGQNTPLLVVVNDDQEALVKSFRNLDRVIVTVPSELEVSAVVWARSLLVSQAALEAVQGRASQ